MEKDFWESGLTTIEAEKRLKQFGSNKLVEARKTSVIRLFFSQFSSPLIYVLLVASLVALLLKDFTDAAVILLAVVMNTFLGFFQEYKAVKGLAALTSMLA